MISTSSSEAAVKPPRSTQGARIQRALPRLALAQEDNAQGISGSAGYEATSYLYAPTSGRDSTFQSLALQLQANASGLVLEFGASANVLLNVRPKVHPYFEVPDLYVGSSQQLAPLQVRLGRKLEPWNQLDEAWQLGIVQPRFRWDYMHPQSVGLLGAFLEFNHSGVRIMGFASPIYVPERGVPIIVDNGQFTSPSAWFIPPSARISLFDRDTPVRYDLQIPRVEDIVFQLSGGLLLKVGGTQGAWASAAYLEKPMNQLLLGHDAHLRLDALEVPVKIAPRVAYHRVASLEAGYSAPSFGAIVSLLHETPSDQSLGPNWTEQTVSPATALSPCINLEVGRASALNLGYLWRWGGNAADRGRDAASDKSVFEARYPFERAIRASVISPGIFGIAPDELTGSTRVIYDSNADGAIWSTELRYQVRPEWRLNAGADFLATNVTSDSPEKDGSNFIRRYQVHNRVQAGVSYVF